MAYGNFKDSKRRAPSDKVLRDKACNIAKNPKYDGYERRLTSMVYKFFDKEVVLICCESCINRLIIRNLKKGTVHSRFIYNIQGADLADMQLISKFNKRYRILLCVINIFSKYAWVVTLKDEKDVRIVDAFQKILNDSNRKPNKIWTDIGSKFYNNSFKKWLKYNDIKMYSILNEGKSVVAERFIKP